MRQETKIEYFSFPRLIGFLCILTQGALAVSLSFRYPSATVLLLFFIVKEIIMLFLNLNIMKQHCRMNSAQNQETILTVIFDIVMIIILISHKISFSIVNLLVFLIIIAMLISFCKYLHIYTRIMKDRKTEKEHKMPNAWKVILGIVSFIIIYISLIILPYVRHPAITDETISEFNISDYYGDDQDIERVRILSSNGEALTERIRLISMAKEEIILSTFDFDADTSGTMVLSALLDASKRGVHVKVIVDGFAYSDGIQCNPWFQALIESENVTFKVYNPIHLLKPWNIMGRLHDKYLIADQRAYILGGRNTYDYFLGDQEGYKNYDWDLLICGTTEKTPTSIKELRSYFDMIWEQKESVTIRKKLLFRKNPAVRKCQNSLTELYRKLRIEHPDWFEVTDYSKQTFPAAKIRLLTNPTTPYPKEPVVFYKLTQLMMQAKKSVFFHTPYIICNKWMMDRLEKVCRKVPMVYMMTNSLANNGNPFGAMDYSVNKKNLLETGLRIMEYDGGISYHGKCATIDDRLSVLGSMNWDMRSAYLDTEMMLVVDSKPLNRELRKEMAKYEADALHVKDIDNYYLKNDQIPQKISQKKDFRIRFIRTLGYWARFLM